MFINSNNAFMIDERIQKAHKFPMVKFFLEVK